MPAKEVVNAVVASTEKYLELLTQLNGGQNKHDATQLQPQGEIFFEDARWIAYRCHLDRFLSVRSDSSATFVSDAQPGTPIEIYLIDYNRRSGSTKFAAKTALPEGDGRIDIDFRWLVQRCLDWYRSKGSAVAEIEGIAELGVGQSACKQAEGQSADQFQAVQTILTEGLSYVWGPPGTGKTTWVLAKAAAHCVRQYEKILVLASTNLAVDNALVAILKEGIAREDVLRVGIPSEEFSKYYPECCEDRVFAAKIREIEREKKELESARKNLERRQQWGQEVRENQSRLESVKFVILELKGQAENIQHQLKDEKTRFDQSEQEATACHDLLIAKTKEWESIAFDDLVNEITAMESDHVQTVKLLSGLEKQLDGLGCWGSITGKKRKLAGAIAGDKRHLGAVEGTLVSLRQRRTYVEPRVAELKRVMAELEERCSKAAFSFSTMQRNMDQLRAQQRAIRCETEATQQEHDSIAAVVDKLNDQLETAEDFGPAEQWEHERRKWQIRIQELQAALDQYRQDFDDKMVLGMTLDAFIGLTMQRCLDVSRVFIDEAPYAPLAKVIPVLSLHRPIAMLGDHCQLPPVYEGKNSDMAEAYWGKPAIFVEDAFQLSANFHALNKLDEPGQALIKRVILKESYRFGPRLAQLLDKYVYKGIGLQGRGEYDTLIESVDCEPYARNGRVKRQNDAEIDKILQEVRDWWGRMKDADSTLAILTPYKSQQYLINKMMRNKFRGNLVILDRVEVWSVHQSQGREWDSVFLSASDTGRLAGNDPWFSDSRRLVGRAILNTAVSRAKRHLRIFNDRAWWGQQKNSILTELANEPE